jgi:hypothetical protein
MHQGTPRLALLSLVAGLGLAVGVAGGCGNVSVSRDAGRDGSSGGSGGRDAGGGTGGGAGGGTGGSAGSTGAGGSVGTGGGSGSGGRTGTGGNPGTGGGSATGGRGGSGTGGSPGTGGRGGGGGGSGTGGAQGTGGAAGGASPECKTDGDCRIFSDCCTCEGLAAGERDPPTCDLVCIQDRCAQLGLTIKAAACVAGRCVAGFQCDGKVTCRAAEPVCPVGNVAVVLQNCWGGCVPTTECASVVDCARCAPSGHACATTVTQLGVQPHCVTVPQSCGGNTSCSCLGPSVCLAPYSSCANQADAKGVSCSCPNC